MSTSIIGPSPTPGRAPLRWRGRGNSREVDSHANYAARARAETAPPPQGRHLAVGADGSGSTVVGIFASDEVGTALAELGRDPVRVVVRS